MGKAKVEAEESMRALMLALNGLAGCMVLQGDRAGAVAVYREALATGGLARAAQPRGAARDKGRWETD